MIQKFVDTFIQNRAAIEQHLATKPDWCCDELARYLVEGVLKGEYIEGDYDGIYTGNFVYDFTQNKKRHVIEVGYGSCSVCDTIYKIRCYPSSIQPKMYADLLLHMVQRIEERHENHI